ncbi:hypothetical protein M8494_12930 [Serratia ureilytica]
MRRNLEFEKDPHGVRAVAGSRRSRCASKTCRKRSAAVSLTDDEVQALARQAILIENITAARWISSGRKTAIPASC